MLTYIVRLYPCSESGTGSCEFMGVVETVSDLELKRYFRDLSELPIIIDELQKIIATVH